MKKVLTVAAFALVGALFAAGCGAGAAKTSSDSSDGTKSTGPQAQQIKVADVANNPMAYDGMIVETEGNYAVGYCSACFLLKDGVSAVRCEVSDTAPLPPESKLGARMRVSGKVYVVKGSPNIILEKIEYL